MSVKHPKFPVRAAELIGKKVATARNGCIVDEEGAVIAKDMTYEEAENVALVMNHVEAVWEPRFRALEERMRARRTPQENPNEEAR